MNQVIAWLQVTGSILQCTVHPANNDSKKAPFMLKIKPLFGSLNSDF